MLNYEEAEPAPEKLTPLRKEPRRRGKLSVKRVVGAALVLVLGLAAAVYLLFFKKGTTSTPTDRTSPADKKAEERSQPPRPNRQPTRPPATAGTGARVPAANDPFNQYIKQAGAQIQAGELPQALLTLQWPVKSKSHRNWSPWKT